MEEFGKAKKEWLKTFPGLPGGIPSHDTFNRLLNLIALKLLENEKTTKVGIRGKRLKATSGRKKIRPFLCFE
jgi:hypothetical protein